MDEFPRVQQNNTHYFSRSKSLHLPDLSNNETAVAKTHGSVHECDQEDGAGEIFGVILSRSRSVSSGAAPRESTTKAEKQKKGLAKVTLAMKRSFSVSGGYCRIHDQHDIINGGGGGGENMNPNVFHKRTVKKKGKILKACMRLLGL
nr:proline-rich receptor-like protein kinase PERK4 [Ipomoea batatas]